MKSSADFIFHQMFNILQTCTAGDPLEVKDKDAIISAISDIYFPKAFNHLFNCTLGLIRMIAKGTLWLTLSNIAKYLIGIFQSSMTQTNSKDQQ